ncbi:hypothetical protein LTR86_002464 [Recurvomyces mirabilis]|nr:hypothetical protein LTR86_002464 [Recurvomyces mirabilis]
MDYRQLTPPTMLETDCYDVQCPGGSASTVGIDFDWSPETAMTSATTPPHSPPRARECGPTLLPKIRPQDQLLEPERRSVSPPALMYLASPLSVPSPFDHMINDEASSRRPSLHNIRSASTSNIRTHSRNISSSSVDASMLSRYGYPTYRHSPTPQPVIHGLPMTRTPSAMSFLAPIVMQGSGMQSYPQRRRTASPPARPSQLSHEVEYDPALDLETITTLDYLTSTNPAPSLVQKTAEPRRGQDTHFWYDVRNVRAWSDFDVRTITAVPELWKLLQTPVARRMLPEAGRVNTSPETSAQLVDACAQHHAVKVNAALKLAQGDKHMAMRTLKLTPSSRQQPEFVSSYQSDAEKTIYGDGRGRVVGIVKCHDQWNSGMRNGDPTARVDYLQTLAKLQRFMREHGTRYGFIMTEIELVCVRAGGPPSEETDKPLFGFLEVAAAIPIAASGNNENGNLQMTTGLALWWLHMLARDELFPGQYRWRLNVGPPGELTRQNHLKDRDSWMPKPTQKEKRDAKRVRGWVFPDEPLSKRECGKMKRVKA